MLLEPAQEGALKRSSGAQGSSDLVETEAESGVPAEGSPAPLFVDLTGDDDEVVFEQSLTQQLNEYVDLTADDQDDEDDVIFVSFTRGAAQGSPSAQRKAKNLAVPDLLKARSQLHSPCHFRSHNQILGNPPFVQS